MKKLIVLLTIAVSITRLSAQTCKIKIYYDENGSRTQRVLECIGGKPAPENTAKLDDSKSALSSLAAIGFQVYPNPANDRVNVKLDDVLLTQGTSITLTDLSGRILQQQQKVSNLISSFDLQGYTDGVYLITIVSGNNRQTIKIVKQNGSK